MASPTEDPKMQKLPVNAGQAAFARDFMRALADDPRFGNETIISLEDVLEKHKVPNGAGGIDGAETAKRLISSLNEALPDYGHDRRLENGSFEKVVDLRRDITKEQQLELVERLTGVNTVQDAVKALQRPTKDGKTLIEFLYARGPDDYNDFAVAYTSVELGMLRSLFGGVGMGGFVDILEKGAGLSDTQSPDERAMLEPMEQGFELIMGGAGVGDLAAYWDLNTKEITGEDGKPVIVTRYADEYLTKKWVGPEGGRAALEALFKGVDDTSSRDRPYSLNMSLVEGETTPQFTVQSFDSLIMQRWVELGVVEFSSIQDRIDANTHAANIVFGMDLTPQHASSITQDLSEDQLIPASAAGALASFLDTQLDLQNMRCETAAERAVKYLEQQGVTLEYPEALERALSQRLNDFTPAHSSSEFAQRMRAYFDAHQVPARDLNAIPENDPNNPEGPAVEAGSVEVGPLNAEQLQKIALPAVVAIRPVAAETAEVLRTSVSALQEQVTGEDISYGQSIELSSYELSNYLVLDEDREILTFALDEHGRLEANGVLKEGAFASGNVDVQVFEFEDERIGYFVSNQTGDGFYLGANAFDLDQLKADKPELYQQLGKPAPQEPAIPEIAIPHSEYTQSPIENNRDVTQSF